MTTIHLMLQGKGGVGKSFVSSLLFQYLREREGFRVVGYDTDPINATFAGYKEFDVTSVNIMDGDDLVPRRFDALIEKICALSGKKFSFDFGLTPQIPPETIYDFAANEGHESTQNLSENLHVVVDNGSACFPPLCSYLKTNKALNTLRKHDFEIVLHTVVTGGQALGDTLSGLKSLVSHFAGIPIVVWLNPYFGEIVLDGQNFYNFKVYSEFSSNLKCVIELPTLRSDTFGHDLEELLAKRLSFRAAVESNMNLMMRQRLFMIWREIAGIIDQTKLVPNGE